MASAVELGQWEGNVVGRRYRRTVLDLADGPICVGQWQGKGPTIFALHGISSNHLLWTWAAHADPDLNIIAPDLRGRGGSAAATPGIAAHATTMVEVLDHLDLDDVVLAGMSLGGYVAVAMAAQQPGRFSRVALVDGGLPMAMDPAGADAFLDAIAQRSATDTTFASVDDYIDTYLSQFDENLERRDSVMRAFLAWNLRGEEPALTVKLPKDALVGDARDVFYEAPVATWLATLTVPVDLIHAEAALPTESPAEWAARLPRMSERMVPGTDHATIVMGQRGGQLTASLLRGGEIEPPED